MKSIFLISSIFYILGLKIGYKIDLFKNINPVQKINTTTDAVKKATKVFHFNNEEAPKTNSDSIPNSGLENKKAPKTNNN
jgi:hypothetical protein